MADNEGGKAMVSGSGSGGTKEQEIVEFNQCQEAVKRLNDFLDHELRPEEEATVRAHLRECRGCFAKFHFEETLLRTIRERVQQVSAPGSLRHKILTILGQAAADTPPATDTAPASTPKAE